MKRLIAIVSVCAIGVASAAGFHRSFRNGYPAEARVTREASNSAQLKAPKQSRPKVKVVTNVVVRCAAKTKSGSLCTRKAAPGEKLCRQHLLIEQKKAKEKAKDSSGDRPRKVPAN